MRISLKSSVDLEHVNPVWDQLRAKISSRSASRTEELEFRKRADEIAETLLKMPEDDLFDVTHIENAGVPRKARIFRSVMCYKCGEPVSELGVRQEKGEATCIPCSEGIT